MAGGPVLSFGETLIDLIASDGSGSLEEVAAFVVRPGGAPANAAVALSRLGVPAAFCGVVGADPFGTKLRHVLDAEGVDTSRLRATGEAATTIAFAWKDDRGDGHFFLVSGADRLLEPADVDRASIPACAAIVIGSVALAAEPARTAIYRAVEIASNSVVPVCFDVNVRPAMWRDRDAAMAAVTPVLERATLLKLSLDDVAFLAGRSLEAEAAFEWLRAYPAKFRVLTDGGRGAWFERGSGDGAVIEYVPAFRVDAIEPTGAGDAFTAATIGRLMGNGWSTLDTAIIRFASAAGALATTRRGAMEALPVAADVEAFLAQRG